jgi:hypothetical protein
MRVIKIKSLLIIAGVLGFFACNEVTEKLIPSKKSSSVNVEAINNQAYSVLNNSPLEIQEYKNLSISDIQKIAVLHNTFLDEVELNIDWYSGDASKSIESSMMELNSNGLSYFSLAEKQGYLAFTAINTNMNFLNNNYGSEAMSILNNTKEYLLSNENFTISELESYIASSNMIASKKLQGIELDGVLVFLAVLEKSANYWLPVDRGGSGNGVSVVNANDKVKNANFWGELLLADAMGATSVLTGIGLTLLATPPTATALAGVVGFAAATASLWSLV